MTLVQLHPEDDVAVAPAPLRAGSREPLPDGRLLTLREDVPAGHKVAVRDLPAGATVRKYGQVIAETTAAVAAGAHLHLHNLAMPADPTRRSAVDPGAHGGGYGGGRPGAPGGADSGALAGLRRSFAGLVRPDGSVATRNYIGVLTTVNCSATVARAVAARCEGALPEGVDGVVALTHGTGCGMASSGPGWDLLRRTLTGYARHPNLAALVVIGLGCEVNTLSGLLGEVEPRAGVPVVPFTIQDAGGTREAIARGVGCVGELAGEVAGATRSEVSVAHLVLGLQCGGSDGWSGLTANPALGVASDLLVAAGGSSLLGETPEIYGAEHLLASRATDPAVAARLLERIRWWEEYTRAQGTTLDGNPSPGNRDGGITTILEKSLGAVAKAGGAPLAGVCDYAEPPPGPGLSFMDTPGYDPVSVTGMVAGGANLICFTTGRGSVFGSRPVPTVKLATNAELARRLAGDIDLDCSPIAAGEVGVAEMGRRIYDLLLDVASGQRSQSEELGLGGEEIVPWQIGAVL